MTSDERSYWRHMLRRRYSRRSLMRAALLAGTGVTAGVALACTTPTTKSSTSSKPGAPARAGAQANAGVQTLDGRSGSEPKGPPVRGGTLNWYITGNPPVFDPNQNVSVNTGYLASAVYSRLLRYQTPWDIAAANNLATEPDLAATAESTDAVTWTVKLRSNIKFQNISPVNGRAVEAEDVKQSFINATSPKAVNAANLGMIDPTQIQTPDKQTVLFKLKYPYAPFVAIMASPFYSWIFPREAYTGFDPAKEMIGSGPFTLDSFTPDVAVTLKRNPAFYETGRPYLDGVKVAILPDAGDRNAQFISGHLDYLSNPLVDDVPSMKQEAPRADVIQNVTNGNGVMFYNLRDSGSIFRDIRMRQALSLIMDRDSYGRGSGFGSRYIQTFSVPPNVGKWAAMAEDYPSGTLQWYKYDPQQAKQLMDAAGAANQAIQMLYPAGNPADPQLGRQADIALSMVKQLPWTVTYATVDYNREWIAGGKGIGYPGGGVPADAMAWWGWSSRPSIDEYLFSFWHSKGAGNLTHINDPQIDAGIDKARATLNDDARVQAYKDVQRYIASQVYVLMGLVNGLGYTFISPRAQNYRGGDFSAPGMGFWSQMWLTS